MGCYKLTYYPKETLTRVRGGKASREKNVEWVWLSVDPLAHEFPSWTPYHYVHNNPVNMIDPDGRAALPPEAGEFEDGFVWTDNDGSYTFDGETQTWTPNDENSLWTDWADEVEVTTTLSKHEKTMQNPIVKAVHRAHGDFLRGTAELGAHTLQQTGDLTALAGYGLTLTGVGAPLGIPLAAVGTGMSTVGGGIQAGLHFMDGNNGAGARTLLFTAGSAGATALPGKGLGYEVLRQNLGLKISGANRLIND